MQKYRQVNLIIDQGNTTTKIALMEGNTVVRFLRSLDIELDQLDEFLAGIRPQYGIFSSVRNIDPLFLNLLKGRADLFLIFDNLLRLPIIVDYKTPETLGKDRLAAVIGAQTISPCRDLLVIDAGTAITYELLTIEGTYLGGNISPGLTLRFKSLHLFTEKLPLVKQEIEVPPLGKSTEEAILSGVVLGIVKEMEGYINEFRLKYPNLLVFLTGGDAAYFESRLKSRIFANKNLVLTGLNRLIEYNVEKK